MIGKWKSIYFCGGYCETGSWRVVRGQLPVEDPTQDKGTLITDKSPASHGWVSTNDKRWSRDGNLVWLCPDCQARWEEEKYA